MLFNLIIIKYRMNYVVLLFNELIDIKQYLNYYIHEKNKRETRGRVCFTFSVKY